MRLGAALRRREAALGRRGAPLKASSDAGFGSPRDRFMRPSGASLLRPAGLLRRAGAWLLLAGGFVLGSVATLGMLALVGELGEEPAGSQPSARLQLSAGPGEPGRRAPARSARARQLPPAPAEQPRADPVRTPEPTASSYEALVRRDPILPVAGVDAARIQDTFSEKRGGTRRHEATDILAPRGAPVVAFDDGVVKKLFESKQGGLTVYQFDRTETYCFYYAHLDRYAPGLKEGALLRRGERIGDVGTTGNAPPGTPHLHFAIFLLGPEKRWWQGTPINPYPILVALARENR